MLGALVPVKGEVVRGGRGVSGERWGVRDVGQRYNDHAGAYVPT